MGGASVRLANAQEAQACGVAAIYQEPLVFPDLDVAENIFITHRDQGVLVCWKRMYTEAEDLLASLGVRLDVRASARGLTLASQQAVEIAKAISLRVKILIMDEPTASLSDHEVRQLFRVGGRYQVTTRRASQPRGRCGRAVPAPSPSAGSRRVPSGRAAVPSRPVWRRAAVCSIRGNRGERRSRSGTNPNPGRLRSMKLWDPHFHLWDVSPDTTRASSSRRTVIRCTACPASRRTCGSKVSS